MTKISPTQKQMRKRVITKRANAKNRKNINQEFRIKKSDDKKAKNQVSNEKIMNIENQIANDKNMANPKTSE